jgi:xylulokinase
MGVVRPGMVSATIGTSGVVFAAPGAPALDPKGRIHTFCHAIPGRWHVMGVTQAAGLSLRWFRDRFGTPNEEERFLRTIVRGSCGCAPPGLTECFGRRI